MPLKFCGFSPCYRSEIGSYGKETKGLYRVHEFYKVEQVVIAPASVDLTNEIQKEMVDVSKEMHEELGLPYRQLQICTADMGTGKYKMFDIEAWMAGQNAYREIVSCSNCIDYQSRRLKIRFRDKSNEDTKYIHTLNSTLIAIERTMVAILENNQTKDGHVEIPKVLQKYLS